MKKQTIKRCPHGHGYVLTETSQGQKKFRADKEVVDFIMRNSNNITYDTHNDSWKYIVKRGPSAGTSTSLQKMIYSAFKAKKALSEVDRFVRFKNGLNYDFRLKNLTTRKANSARGSRS